MKILIVGGSGATGRLLVRELLDRGQEVRIIVRSPEKLPDFLQDRERLEIVKASLLDLSDEELAVQVQDCDSIASCLGHNINFKGIWGKPRRLVTDACRRLCSTIQANSSDKKVKFVLMNTVGNRNRDLKEPISLGERFVIALLRIFVPPHPDNEQAAEYLRTRVGQNHPHIEWAAVRPDTLIDEEEGSRYEIHPSPVRSGIFNAGKTSRINVAHFMAELITEAPVWERWKGQMPVIYNEGFGLEANPKAEA